MLLLCLHAPPCLFVSLNLCSLLITSALIGNFIVFPLLGSRSLNTDHCRSSTPGLRDLGLGHRPIRRIRIDRIPVAKGEEEKRARRFKSSA